MKTKATYIFLMFGIILSTTGFSQFPSAFVAPKGMVLIVDSAFHKGATVIIERKKSGEDFKQLDKITVPINESDFHSRVESAAADFPGYPATPEKTLSSWWKGLNESKPMPVFLMNPAGIIASGMGFYDKTVRPGEVYDYRVTVRSSDGTTVSDNRTGNVYSSNAGKLPVPRCVKIGEDADVIRLTWGYATKKIPAVVRIYRLDEGKNDYREIGFYGGFNAKGDSIMISARDTAVTPMSMYRYYILAYDWLENPFPVSDTILARSYSIYAAPAIRTIMTHPVPAQHAIRLSWPKLNGTGLRGILLFRGATRDGNFQHLATLPATDTAFLDVVPKANETYWYFVVVANRFGYSLPSVRTFDLVTASSNPMKPSMPHVEAVTRGAKITWRYGGGMIRGYTLYRGEGYRGELLQLSDFIAPADSMSYLDTTAVPGNAYRYSLQALGEGMGISPLSEAVSIMLPANGNITIPGMLHYRNDGVHIMLFWDDLLLSDGQVNGYSVYRRISDGAGFVKLTQTPIPKLTNSFTDSITFFGKTVEYSIASVDIRGVESRRSNPVAIMIPPQEFPVVDGLSVIDDGGQIMVRWAALLNPSLAGYAVYRFSEDEEPSMIGKASAGESTYVDKTPVRNGKMNNYFVRAVFIDGTESDPGEIASIRLQ
jgi:hypothetical protein